MNINNLGPVGEEIKHKQSWVIYTNMSIDI